MHSNCASLLPWGCCGVKDCLHLHWEVSQLGVKQWPRLVGSTLANPSSISKLSGQDWLQDHVRQPRAQHSGKPQAWVNAPAAAILKFWILRWDACFEKLSLMVKWNMCTSRRNMHCVFLLPWHPICTECLCCPVSIGFKDSSGFMMCGSSVNQSKSEYKVRHNTHYV